MSDSIPTPPAPEAKKTIEADVVSSTKVEKKTLGRKAKDLLLLFIAFIGGSMRTAATVLLLSVIVVCTAPAIYQFPPKPTASVIVPLNGVEEKGWFGNLLWRNDSSKVIRFDTKGSDVQISGRRANGEKTRFDLSDGKWHIVPNN